MTSAENRAPKKRFPYIRLMGTLLTVALLVYLLWKQGWGEISAALQQITWWRFALAFALMLVSRLAVSIRWYVLLRSAGVKITPWQTVRISLAGLFASNFLPTTIGGDVARLGGILRMKYDEAVGMASLVADRLVGMAGMALALPLALPALVKLAGGSAALPGVALLAGVTPQAEAAPDEHGLLARVKIWLRSLIRRFLDAFKLWAQRPRALLAALSCTLIHQACLYGMLALLLAGMGENVPLWTAAGLWSLQYFISQIPVSINGIGLQDTAFSFLFFTFGGMAQANSLVLALLMLRIFPIFASLPGALFLTEMIEGRKGKIK